MAQAKLVTVPGGPLHSDVGEVQFHHLLLSDAGDGDYLPGDGVGIFHTGVADIPAGNAHGGGDAVDSLKVW